jgi:hypothetical protein
VEQLKAELMQKAGLSPEQADKALVVVADFLKNNLSDDMIQSIAGKAGLGDLAGKLPDNVGDTLSGFLRKHD